MPVTTLPRALSQRKLLVSYMPVIPLPPSLPSFLPPPSPSSSPLPLSLSSSPLPLSLPPSLFLLPFPSPLPSPLQPWQMKAQQVATGSGFVVEGRCILTNAHVVDDYTTVRVRKHGHPMKYNARVLVSCDSSISPGLLAVISLCVGCAQH